MDLVLITLLGGVLALDATSVGQFMISRPLVAGALTGWLTGDPASGILIGSLLEIYLLVSFPTGGSRFPEASTATVVAVAVAGTHEGEAALPVAIAVGLVWGQIGAWTITGLRRLNGRFVPEPRAAGVAPGVVVRAHLSAILLDLLRGMAVTLAGVVVGRWVVTTAAPAWPLAPNATLGLVLAGAAVSAGILLRSFGGFHRRRLLFTLGLALGILGVRLW